MLLSFLCVTISLAVSSGAQQALQVSQMGGVAEAGGLSSTGHSRERVWSTWGDTHGVLAAENHRGEPGTHTVTSLCLTGLPVHPRFQTGLTRHPLPTSPGSVVVTGQPSQQLWWLGQRVSPACLCVPVLPTCRMRQTSPLPLDHPVWRSQCCWRAWSCTRSHRPRRIDKPGHRAPPPYGHKGRLWSKGHRPPLTFGPRSEFWVEANTHWQSGEQRRLVGLLGDTRVLDRSCSWGTVSAYRKPSAQATCKARAVLSTWPHPRTEVSCLTASLLRQCHLLTPGTDTSEPGVSLQSEPSTPSSQPPGQDRRCAFSVCVVWC